ncbi:MAG: SPOR domain-containing protein [Chitinispirillaceae bacterium]|jgi:cell division septation protein DedD|nr:SPOR domain-containing protein [Chitinispirillaceae bacterium]
MQHVFAVGLYVFVLTSLASAQSSDSAQAEAEPCSTTMIIYETIAADTAQSDSARAVANARRGDLSFSLCDYGVARDFYGRAAALDTTEPRHRFFSGRAALADGDTAAAEAAFAGCTGEKTALSREAEVALGEIAMHRGEYAVAIKRFGETGIVTEKNSWSLRALAGKLVCARNLKMPDSVAIFEKQLAPYSARMLEMALNRKTAIVKSKSVVKAEARPVRATADKKTVDNKNKYTLQVGAFSTQDQALAAKKRLEKKFDDITVSPTRVSGRTRHRVRIGYFSTHGEAEAFGRTRLEKQGLEYRVVVR